MKEGKTEELIEETETAKGISFSIFTGLSSCFARFAFLLIVDITMPR